VIVSSDDRERDALIAEHLFGWRRMHNPAMLDQPSIQGFKGWVLIKPGDPHPDRWETAPDGLERAGVFWMYMEHRIPKYSQDVNRVWEMIEAIIPSETPIRSTDGTVEARMIVPPVPPERQHAVVIRGGSGELFLDWHVDIRTRDGRRSICGSAGASLPRAVATAMATLIGVELWKNGKRTDR